MAPAKKPNRMFCAQWEEDFFFIAFNNKALCVICKKTVTDFKKFNISRHYSIHESEYGQYTGEERRRKLLDLKQIFLSDQSPLVENTSHSAECAVRASYEVATLIAKHSKPFSEGEFIKGLFLLLLLPYFVHIQ